MNGRRKLQQVARIASTALLAVSLALTPAVPVAYSGIASVDGLRAHAAQGDETMQAASASGLGAEMLQGEGSAPEDGKAYTLPVRMLKRAADEASMASPVMHPTAYALFESGVYTVKVYFVNAPIMSSTIYAGSLGAATYDKAGDGVMIPADSDVYDKKTQVKTVTMTLASLDEPVAFHLDMFMDNVRLVFDTSQMAEAEGEPAFPEVESSDVKYPADSVAVIGGTGSDSANALARCPNGSLVVAGSTSSTDQSFSGRAVESEQAYLSVCSEDGEAISTSYLTGADKVSLFDLSASADSSFFTCGYFQEGDEGAAGDFSGLVKEGCEEVRHGFVAKYSANNKLQWARSVCSTQACQYDGVAATPDGGCVAVVEYLKGGTASDFYDEITGIVNTIVVKYDASGDEEWHTVLTGSSIIDTDGAVAVTERGTYLVAGSFAYLSASGAFSSLERFGGTFDIYVAELDAQGAVINARSYGGSATNESACDIIPTSDEGYAFVGSTASSDATFASSPAATGASNGYVVKCKENGSLDWVSTCKSTQDNEASRVIEQDGAFVVIGYGEGKDGDFTELAKGQRDAYVAQYDAQGHRTSLRTFGGSKNDYASGVVGVDDGGFVVLFESESSDVDLEGVARGGSDALLVWTSGESDEDAQYAVDLLNASAVEEIVTALPDAWDVEDSDRQAIADARREFDALNAGATALVPESLIEKLQLAEAAIGLSSSARLAVRSVVSQLESLPAAPGVKDASVVARARQAYDALSDSQKAIVPAKLVAALASAEQSVSAAQALAQAQASAAAHTIAAVKVTGSYVYTGSAIKPTVVVTAQDGSLVSAANYTAAYVGNKEAGTAAVTVTGKGAYTGAATATFKVAKAAAKVSATKSKTYKAKSLKKKAATFKALKVATDGKVSWKVTKSDPRKVLSFKSGKVTVKKKAKAGSYSLKVKVSAKAGANYKALSAKTYTIKVKVK